MARRSLRVSAAGNITPRSSSKRPNPSTSASTSRPSTAKRSRTYQGKIAREEEDLDEFEQSLESEEDAEASGYEDASTNETSEEDPSEEDNTSSEEYASRGRKEVKRSSNGKAATMTAKSRSAKDVTKPNSRTGLGPGTQVIIKKPRARSPGDTPYTDETIHPNTMLFLKELAANNDRQWLKMHDPDYRASWKDFETFLDAMTQGITTVDETVPELPLKDIIFRIYRDVRFSKDQTPYKTAFSAAWSRTGRKGPYAVYYLQIKPNGGSLIAGGMWMPEAAALAKIRRDIDRRPQQIKSILASAGIRQEYLGGVSKDQAKVVKRFVDEHKETSLKTKPKGFEADHKDIALLRLKNFTLHRKLSDSEVVSPNAVELIVGLMAHLVPFVTYLNSVVQPDEASDGENDEGSEESETEYT